MEVPDVIPKCRPALRPDYRLRSKLESPYSGANANRQECSSLSSRLNTDTVTTDVVHGTCAKIEESEGEQTPHACCRPCHFLVENRWVRRFFRVCAVLNLLSLMSTASFQRCTIEDTQNCDNVFIQYATITCVDFVLALIYTVQSLARLNYAIYIHTRDPETSSTAGKKDLTQYTSFSRLLIVGIVTLSLWYSVGIGIYRTYRVKDLSNPTILPYLYWLFIPRTFATISALKLFLHFGKLPTSEVGVLLKNIKWTQLGKVILFYTFFTYMFALLGVHWIGGLSERCTYNYKSETTHSTVTLMSIPTTHCNSDRSSSTYFKNCFDDSNMICSSFPNTSTALNIDFRNSVYLGQFRYIVDGLFAVYDASSLELWYFMEKAAIHGAPQTIESTIVFYTFLVFFLVFYLQQSIFLVVIIESFADLRSVSDDQSNSKQKSVPTVLQLGISEDQKIKLQNKQRSAEKLVTNVNKYYVGVIEKVFILLVVVDAIVTATKYTGMSQTLARALGWWQLCVSILFIFEIIGLFSVHLLVRPNQLQLFVREPYYWYLIVIAVGGLIASLPPLYDPMVPSTPLAIFQAFRLPRTIRLLQVLKKFFLKIFGRGQQLLVVALTVLVFLIWFAVISMLILGYLKPAKECQRLGNEFEGFLEALQSIFQIMIVEGWNDLSSEAMCHRERTWWLINLYFILIHLFVSFILVNFFTAVILDNLDYDDETKKKKLENELTTRKITKIPWHLKVFKLSGPKRVVQYPKMNGTSLTEAEVRNFYDVVESTDFPLTCGRSALPSDGTKSEVQQLSKLELLNIDSSKDFPNGMQATHLGVQNILGHIKDYRQYRNEISVAQTNNAGLILLRKENEKGKHKETSSFLQSEYDEYREKYRLFDSALFCMPPEHKLRRWCRNILTWQCDTPEVRPSLDKTRKLSFIPRLLAFCLECKLFVIRYVVSRLPYFTWAMIMITLLTLSFQFEESLTEKAQISRTPYYYWPVDAAFILATFVELILKIIANGLFFNPKAAIRSSWDVLDWLIVLTNLAGLLALCSVCGGAPRQTLTLKNVPIWIELLLLFRALRPVRLISLIPSMRKVFYEVLVLGGKKLILGSILLLVLIFMFASLGVQLFAGNNSPEGFCNDPNVHSESECMGNFFINIEISPDEFLPTPDYDVGIYVHRVWYEHRRDFRFNNIGFAMLTLFEVMTTEGWLDVRDMFSSVQDGDLSDTYMRIYLHVYVFFVVNLGLQLFVSIVVNTYNEHKPDHSALLTVHQKRWTDLMQRITSSLITPIKQPPSPRGKSCGCKIRCFLYNVFTHSNYVYFSTFVILFHSLTVCVPWIEEPNELRITTTVVIYTFLFFAVFYIIEFFLKFLAFGKAYFRSWRNMFDVFLVLFSLCCIVYAIINRIDANLAHSPSDPAVVLILLKLFTILTKYGTLRNLLITVGLTVVKSASLIGFLISMILTYAFIGNLYFQRIQVGETIDHGSINFDGILSSLLLTVRVVTGENWHEIFWDTMAVEPYCSNEAGNCGRPFVAVLWFISYYFFVTFIFINVIIAVLLENFSIFYDEENTAMSHAVVKNFRQSWFHFDKDARGVISRKHIKLLLRMLKLTRLYTYSQSDGGTLKERRQYQIISDPLILREIEEELHQEFKQPEKPKDNNQQSELQNTISIEDSGTANEKYSFKGVLKTLAYRAEDISKQLIPIELHSRQELEEHVQIDVAEECILKWIHRFVRPVVIDEYRRERKLTEATKVPRIILRAESSATYDSDDDSLRPKILTPFIEEDDGLQRIPRIKSPSTCSKETADSADEDDQGTGFVLREGESSALARSYAKIAKTRFIHGFKQDEEIECKEWFKAQHEWLDNVGEKSEYFDDYL